MTVDRDARMGSRMKELIFDAADVVLFRNLIRPSTPGYTGLLRRKYSFTIFTSDVSKN
jgi:hypothetical protein